LIVGHRYEGDDGVVGGVELEEKIPEVVSIGLIPSVDSAIYMQN
jgi:hypothetical protein